MVLVSGLDTHRFPFAPSVFPGVAMFYLARVLQLIGLVEMGYGLFVGFYEADIGREIRLAAIGGAFFLAGWLVQKRLGDS